MVWRHIKKYTFHSKKHCFTSIYLFFFGILLFLSLRLELKTKNIAEYANEWDKLKQISPVIIVTFQCGQFLNDFISQNGWEIKCVRFYLFIFFDVYTKKENNTKIEFRLRRKKQPSRVNVLNKMLRYDRMRKFILNLCNDVMDGNNACVYLCISSVLTVC